ncbi:unannotated protein [freshwater metagenome]|jgi:NAD(P)-dependent dehydrogenase (short-subunit alcohol dehydrogenase family)|uniref:Unannotated protein n=1 Tax=freshwater metagenome TaxID=449393 RepID=A0A6J7L084_9ZZZZ
MMKEPRVAVVTGGVAGIGRALTERLASDGFAIAVADKSDPSSLVEALHSQGVKAFGQICDVSSPDDVRAFAEATLGRFGHVDVLVMNAGIYPVSAFVDMTWAEWDRVFSINVDQLFHFTKAFLPGMLDRKWGRIVCISSTTFHAGVPMQSHYVASKGAVIGFARALAAEVGESGITVNTIAPGLVRTENTAAGTQSGLFDALAAQQAIKRTEEPADLVGPLSFLVSEDAAFITGQTLIVDGGWVRT